MSSDRVLVLVVGLALIVAVNWWFLGEELRSRSGRRQARGAGKAGD
ncbi:MAG TPA: hypothetical protein VNL96_00700 [Gemmatimonadaceae bacterium]|nr:hypothetical protein [Gemmatimonadaceae bacterium]